MPSLGRYPGRHVRSILHRVTDRQIEADWLYNQLKALSTPELLQFGREALKLDRTASVYLDAIRGELRSRQMGEEIKRGKKAG